MGGDLMAAGNSLPAVRCAPMQFIRHGTGDRTDCVLRVLDRLSVET
jgi:hypothetical protein